MQHPTSVEVQPWPEGEPRTSAQLLSERIDPAAEDRYWREHFRSRPYVSQDCDYTLLRPAFRFGWESRIRYFDRTWEEAEPRLQRDWRRRHEGTLPWAQARLSARDAWERVDDR